MSSSSEESEPETKKRKTQIPEHSKQVYLTAYQQFMAWKSHKSKDHISEQVLLEYFQEQSETKSPSTLYSTYSMIRSIVLEKHGINTRKFEELHNFLRQKAVGYKPKKSKLLTAENVETFLNDAPDYDYLPHKVALLLGLYGACHSKELCKLTLKDMHKSSTCLIVDLPGRTCTDRSFAIRREDHLNIIERYQALRPEGMPSDRFFLKCLNGRCVKQDIGKNRIPAMPSQIAEYLKLPDPKHYRGNCFRKSSSLWYLTAKDLTSQNELCTGKVSELQGGKFTSDSEGNENPAKFENVAMKFEDSNDDKNAKPDVNHCLEDENFDPEDDCPLKQIKEEKCDSESVSSEQETLFLDPLNYGPSASFTTAKIAKDCINEHIDSSTETPRPKVTNKVSVNQHVHETTISLPNKTVKLLFKNCKNVSNIRINL